MSKLDHQSLTDIACFDRFGVLDFRPNGILSYFCSYAEGILQACDIEARFLERVGRKIEVIRCGCGDDVVFSSINRPSSINAVRAYKGVFTDICRGIGKTKSGHVIGGLPGVLSAPLECTASIGSAFATNSELIASSIEQAAAVSAAKMGDDASKLFSITDVERSGHSCELDF